MNHTYRVVYNESTNTYVAVAEFAPAKGKKSRSSKQLTAAVLGLSMALMSSNAWSAIVDGRGAGGNSGTTNILRIGTNNGDAVATAGINQTVIGHQAKAHGSFSTVLGSQAEAYYETSTDRQPRRANQVVIGAKAIATGRSSVAVGAAENNLNDRRTLAVGTQSVALGASAVALGEQAMAIGNDVAAIGGGSVAIGTDDFGVPRSQQAYKDLLPSSLRYQTESGRTIGGPLSMRYNRDTQNNKLPQRTQSYYHTLTTGLGAVAIGGQGQALADGAVAIGAGSVAGAATYTPGSNYHNDIEMEIAGAEGVKNAVAGINLTTITGKRATAIGARSLAVSNNATAIGTVAMAGGESTLASGHSSIAYTNSSIALGHGATAGAKVTRSTVNGEEIISLQQNGRGGNNAIAIGKDSLAFAEDSIAIGVGNQVTGRKSGAIGDPSYVSGSGTYTFGNDNGSQTNPITANNAGAFGNNNFLTGDGSRIVGNGNNVSGANTFVMGNNVSATRGNNVILGHESAEKAHAQVTTATVGSLTYSGFAGTATGIVSVGAGGKERQIVNVAPGAINSSSTDAINGSQLYATNNILNNLAKSVKDNFGGNANLTPDGNITFTNIGGTGKNTIHEAIQAANTIVKAGTNIVSVVEGTEGNRTTYTVNAKGATASAAAASASRLSVTPQAKADNVTNYEVALTASALASLNKADTAVQSFTTSVNGTKAEEITAANKDVNFVNGTGTTARNAGGGNITFDVKQATAPQVNSNGSLAKPTNGGDSFLTANAVVDAINNSGFKVKSGGNKATGDNAASQLIKPGDEVTFSAGNNLEVKRVNNEFTFATKQDVKFTSVEVPTGVSGSPITITSGGINAGNKPISNVAPATADNQAVNLGQLKSIQPVVKSSDNTVAVNTQTATNGQKTFDLSVRVDNTTIVKNPDGTLSARVGGTGGTAVETVVKAGDNIASVDRTVENGKPTYTVNAKGVSVGLSDEATEYFTVGAENEGNTTTYKLGFNGTGFTDALDAANSALQSFTTSVNGKNVETITKDNNDVGFVNGTGTTARASGQDITFDVNKTKLTATPINSDGKVNIVGDANSFLSSADTVNLLNNSFFKITASGTENNGTVSGTSIAQIKAGDQINLGAGKNMQLKQSGNSFIYATKDEVNFTSITVPTSGNNNVVINNSGINAGNKPISNVADATRDDQAVNLGQLKALQPKVEAADSSVEVEPEPDDVTGVITYKIRFNGTSAGGGIDTDTNTITEVRDGDGTTAVKVSANDTLHVYKVNINKADTPTVADNGAVNKPADGDKKYLTANAVVDAINNSGFIVTSNTAGTGSQSGTKADQLVKAGEKVTLIAGDNLDVKQDGSNFTFATKPEVKFDKVTSKVIEVPTGTDPDDKPISITKDGINAGGKNITDVADGTNNTDAVNLKQLKESKEVVESGDSNIKVDESKTADGANKYTVSLNPVVTVGPKDGDKKVTIDGTNGTITGLTNTTFDPTATYTGGQAATQEQLKDAINKANAASGFNLTTAADGGSVSNSTVEKVGQGDTVTVKAGKGIEVKQDGKNITIAADTTTLTVNSGKVAEPSKTASGSTPAEADKLVNAGDLADTLNKIGFKVQQNGGAPATKDGATNAGDDIVNAGDAVNFVNGKNTTAKVEKTDSGLEVSFDVVADAGASSKEDGDDAGKVVVNKKDGKDNGNALMNASSVVDAINAAAFRVTGAGNKAEGADEFKANKVSAGNLLTLEAGDNLTLKQTDKHFVFATAKDVKFDSVKVPTDPDNPDDKPITINKDGIDMGGKPITNVAGNLDGAKANTTAPVTSGSKPTTGLTESNVATVGDVLNAGWNLKQQNGSAAVQDKDFVRPFDNVVFADGNGTTVAINTDGTNSTVKYEINADEKVFTFDPANGNKLTVKTGELQPEKNTADNTPTGKVVVPTKGGEQLVNATTVANAINNSGFIVTSNTAGTGSQSGTKADQLVKAGEKVTLIAGDNLDVKQDGSNFTFATKPEVKFDKVTSKVIEVPTGTDPDDKPISITKDGINAGNKPITNVADGEISSASKDAVNGSQLYSLQDELTTNINNTNVNVNKGLSFKGNKGNEFNKKLGDTVTVKGSLANDKAASAQNVRVDVEDKELIVKIAEKPEFKAITLAEGGNSVTLAPMEGNKLELQGKEGKAPVTISNITSGLKPYTAADEKTTTTPKAEGLVNLDNNAVPDNTAVTAGDLRKMGWVVSTDKYSEQVKNADEVKFVGEGLAKVSGETKDGVRVITVAVDNQAVADNVYSLAKGAVHALDSGAVDVNNGDTKKLATTDSVKEAINNSGWKVNVGVGDKTSFEDGAGATKDGELIKPSHSVVFNSGKNLIVKQDTDDKSTSTKITYALADEIEVDKVTVGNVVIDKKGINAGGAKITDVAAGEKDTDAVNVGQLKAVVAGNNNNLNQLGKRINEVADDADGGTASAMAVAGLPQVFEAGKSMVAVAGSTYRGQQGYAVGFSAITDGGNWIVKGTVGGNTRGHFGATVGAGYQW